MYDNFDFILIGRGVSASTFASTLNKRFSDSSILLVKQGRRTGGIFTTKKSRKNKILEFDNVLPFICFNKHISQYILTIILPLINAKKLVDILDYIVFHCSNLNNLIEKNIDNFIKI